MERVTIIIPGGVAIIIQDPGHGASISDIIHGMDGALDSDITGVGLTWVGEVAIGMVDDGDLRFITQLTATGMVGIVHIVTTEKM